MSKDKYHDIFADVDKMNVDNSILEDSALSLVDEWIDTGSYALNAICSGSAYKGIPSGRIVGFTGPSQCGKTLMMTKIIGNFQKEDPDRWGIVFDSEVALDRDTAVRLGANPSQIKHYPIDNVVSARNQITSILNNIIAKNLQRKFIIVIDSLGNLSGGKELKDAQDDKFASDMGTRAKEIKSMLRTLTYRTAKAKTTLLFSNHIYNDPTAMYESAIKRQSGGEGPLYLASLLIQLGFKREKNEKDYENEQIIPIAKKVSGITMHALTTKNRFIPAMLETDLYLNFKTGLDKYSGLFEIAKAMGVITGDRSYAIGDVSLGYRKDFERDPETWEKIILPILDPLLQKEFLFSSEADKLQKEVQAL